MVHDYLLEEKLPHFWCAGCGNGIVLGSLVRVMDQLGLSGTDTVVCTGIGCWGKADDYLREFLPIPEHYGILCAVALGYSDFHPAPLPPYEGEERVKWL